MLIGYFTEQPMSTYPTEQTLVIHPDDNPARHPGDTVLLFPNRFFDPVQGSRLFHERLEHYRLAEEVGFDAVMTNEHHTAPFCMSARISIITSFVAAITDKVKLLQLGNPLPLWDNPVQLAEETAMIDMLSGGRLVAGIVRGSGVEQLANNARALPLGGRPLRLPGGQPLGRAPAEAAPAHLRAGSDQQGDGRVVGPPRLSLHRARHHG
jgi:hypothetical protein